MVWGSERTPIAGLDAVGRTLASLGLLLPISPFQRCREVVVEASETLKGGVRTPMSGNRHASVESLVCVETEETFASTQATALLLKL